MKVIQPTDLHTDDFSISNGKVRVVKNVEKYNLTYESSTIFTDHIGRTIDATNRLYLQVSDGFGKVHIDGKFNTSVNTRIIARLPANAPVPKNLVEAGIYVGESFGSIWINAGTREVYASGIPVGKRIVVDLIGFFA
jgi:hypothetical protein